jgi:hypothetical protein
MDNKGKVCFEFRYDGDVDGDAPLMHANYRYVSIETEGDINGFFDDKNKEARRKAQAEQGKKEPKIKWKNSVARSLLYKDLKEGHVPLEDTDENGNSTMALEDIYAMRIEYSYYVYEKFSSRLKSLRAIVKENNNRAEEDQRSFDNFVAIQPVSHFSHKGYIQWQGSESQELLQGDLSDGTITFTDDGKLKDMGYRDIYDSRPEYRDEFPFKEFRDKVRQEIRTSKYYHTLKVKGKQHKAS